MSLQTIIKYILFLQSQRQKSKSILLILSEFDINQLIPECLIRIFSQLQIYTATRNIPAAGISAFNWLS